MLLARVHIVLPQKDPMDPAQDTLPSASVMMRYRSDYNLEPMRERIRALVAGSVEGLTPAHVSLTLLAVTPVLSFPGNCANGADVPHPAGEVAATTCRHDGATVSSRATQMLCLLAAIILVVAGFMWFWQSQARTWFKRKARNAGARTEPGMPGTTGAPAAADEPGAATATGDKA